MTHTPNPGENIIPPVINQRISQNDKEMKIKIPEIQIPDIKNINTFEGSTKPTLEKISKIKKQYKPRQNIKDTPHELVRDNNFISNNLYIGNNGNNGSSGNLTEKTPIKKANSKNIQ